MAKTAKRGKQKSIITSIVFFVAIIAVVLGVVPDIYPHFFELATMASNAICAGWNGGWM